jgi:hypothetical protein
VTGVSSGAQVCGRVAVVVWCQVPAFGTPANGRARRVRSDGRRAEIGARGRSGGGVGCGVGIVLEVADRGGE